MKKRETFFDMNMKTNKSYRSAALKETCVSA